VALVSYFAWKSFKSWEQKLKEKKPLVKTISECMQSLYSINSTVLLCGDFNFPAIKCNNNLNILHNSVTASGVCLDFFYNALTQLVTQPTRVGGTSRNGSMLDLVFCDDSNFVHNVNVTAPFSSSDHCSVEFDIIHNVKIAQVDVSSYDFSKADWVSIASFLNNVDFFKLVSNLWWCTLYCE